jgi:hypothetical protein
MQAAQIPELLTREPELSPQRPEVMLDLIGRELIDPRGHRGVGGEHAAGRDDLARLGERESVLLHEDPRPLEAEELARSLVHVKDLRGEAERREGRTPPIPRAISCRIRISVSPCTARR